MPKLYYPFVIGIDWLSLYGHQKAEFVQEKNTIFSTEIEEYRTQQYSRRMVIKFNEGGKYIPFAELLFMPCISSIHPASCQLRVVNCFQISNFVLWQTAYQRQVLRSASCELLSN